MTGHIVLDLSRLLSRAARRVPTGIDRVEHAYAETLLTVARSRLRYAALHPLGRFAHLPTARARQFVERTGHLWQHAMPHPGSSRIINSRGMPRRCPNVRLTAFKGWRDGSMPA